MCVRHQLPSSPGYVAEGVCSTGRPVFTHCNTHHKDSDGAAAGGAAAVSEGHTQMHLFVLVLPVEFNF